MSYPPDRPNPADSMRNLRQPTARMKTNKKRFNSLRLEGLEQRTMLTAGANYIVLDFTPDQIANEIRPNDFVRLFTATQQSGSLLAGLQAEDYQFLDFDGQN